MAFKPKFYELPDELKGTGFGNLNYLRGSMDDAPSFSSPLEPIDEDKSFFKSPFKKSKNKIADINIENNPADNELIKSRLLSDLENRQAKEKQTMDKYSPDSNFLDKWVRNNAEEEFNRLESEKANIDSRANDPKVRDRILEQNKKELEDKTNFEKAKANVQGEGGIKKFLGKTWLQASEAVAPGAIPETDSLRAYNDVDLGKIGNLASDFVGNTIGLAMPMPGGGPSQMNVADDYAKTMANKLSPQIATKGQRILNNATRGAIDGTVGGVLDTSREYMQTGEFNPVENIAMGAVGGSALMGGGKAIGEGATHLKQLKALRDFNKLDIEGKGIKPQEAIIDNIGGKAPIDNLDNLPNVKGKNYPFNNVDEKFAFDDMLKPIDDNYGKFIEENRPKLNEEIKTPITEPIQSMGNNVINKPKITNDNFNIRNATVDKAYENYNNAINQMQDHIGHFKMTDDEILNAADDLGIDIFKLVDDIDMAENIKFNPREMQSQNNMLRAMGVKDTPNNINVVNGPEKINNIWDLTKKDSFNKSPFEKDLEVPKASNTPNDYFEISEEVPASAYEMSGKIPNDRTVTIDVPELESKIGNGFKPKDKVLPAMMEKPLGSNDNFKLTEEVPNTKIVENGISENFDPTMAPKNKIVSTEKEKTPFIQKMKNAYTRMVDSNAPLKNVDENTYRLATNSKNVGGTVDHILTENLVDMDGNKIGGGLKEIVDSIPKGKEEAFKEMLYQKHNVARAQEGKPIFYKEDGKAFTGDESMSRYEFLKSENPELVKTTESFTKFIDSFMNEWGVRSGLTKEELYKELRDIYPDYVPTQRQFSQLEKGMQPGSGKGFLDNNSPVRKATGSERDVLDPIENVMNLVNRTVRSARYNEIGQALLSKIESDPVGMKPFVEELAPKDGMFSNTDNVLTVLVDGKQKFLKVNDLELLKSLEGVNTYKSNAFLDGVNKYISNPFKQLITQKNPVFALRNIARDVPSAYIYGSENNPLKFAKNLGSAAKDILTNSDNYQKYKAVGGGGSNFFKGGQDIGMTAKNLTGEKGIPGKIMDTIEKFNNMTETAPRLAEFNKILDETGDIQKALYSANDITTNFSRGGDVAKTIDKFTPYFNAGVQGIDKMFRQFDPRNPKQAMETAIKGGVAITAPTVFFHYLNSGNKAYEDLDNRTKDNYFLIPTGEGKFVKIPKSRELGVLFSSLFERVGRAVNGEEDAFKGFGNTVATNVSVANPIEENIARPFLDLRANKDFANRAIVPKSMENLSPNLQYDEKTTEVSKAIANATKPITDFLGKEYELSPKQIDFLIKSYTGVIGQMGMPLATKQNYKGGNVAGNMLKPITTQFTSDVAYSNQPTTDFYNNLDEITKMSADLNFENDIPSEVLTGEEKVKGVLTKTSKTLSDINKAIKNEPNEDKKRALRIQAIIEAKKANEFYNNVKKASK